MIAKLTENKVFERIDFTVNNLPKGEYENCTFKSCIFFSSDLSNITFNECKFDSCDFSLSRIKNTILNDIKFINCKLLGLHFNDCNGIVLSVYFENCLLKLSNFNRLKLTKTRFKNCDLQDADFTEANLTGSTFENCDLQRAIFSGTNLEKVDFRSSFHYSIDPEKNRIKKARFSRTEVIGLLSRYDIEIE